LCQKLLNQSKEGLQTMVATCRIEQFSSGWGREGGTGGRGKASLMERAFILNTGGGFSAFMVILQNRLNL